MRALVTDLDGVLRIWDPSIITEAERYADLPPGTLARAAFGNAQRLHAAVVGKVDDAAWRAGVAAAIDREVGGGGAQAVQRWSGPAGRVDAEVLAVLRQERLRRPVVLLTNATSRLRDDLDHLDLEGEFDVVINSSEHGVAKPDPGIFHIAAEHAHRSLTECLFVDDTPANVAAATAVGMTGHHFTDVASLRRWLADEAHR